MIRGNFCAWQIGREHKNTEENGEKERDPAGEETMQEVQSELHSFI